MEIRSLGRYEIRGRLGRGTMGIVYRGYDPVLEREIALKTVDFGPAVDEERRGRFLKRFFQEARIAAKLLHSNIVVTHDAATDEASGIPFIAMELVSGGSLHERVSREGRLSWQEALRLVAPLARALDYAHREGVVHRDIKPANVLLTVEGAPKIADFGIAKLPDSELTHTGTVIGTPYYMSPEQLEADELDGRSDLFSLGALLYSLIAGAPPFRGEDIATITQQILYKNPVPLSEAAPGLPSSIDGVIARALAKKADERYASGVELADDLDRLARGEAPLRPLSLGEKTVESTPKPEASQRELELEEAPSSSFAWILVLVVASLLVGAWIRWQDVSDFVSARVTSAETTFRENREEVARREELARRVESELDSGHESFALGHWDDAAAAFDEALRLSREAENGSLEARSLLWLGKLRAETGDWSRARADLESASAVFQIYGDALGAAEALGARADLERDLGSFDNAAALYHAAEEKGLDVSLERSVFDLFNEDVAGAEAGLRSVYERSGNESDRTVAALYLGAIALARGDVDVAERLWIGADVTEVELFRGYAALALGKAEESRAPFEAAAAHCRSRGDRARLASALDGLSGRRDEGVLRTVFLGERRTARNDERRKRLPLTVAPPSE